MPRSSQGGRGLMHSDLEQTTRALVPRGKGILAADETVGTITKRFDALGIPSTSTTRRDYRELLITAPGAAEFLSGVGIDGRHAHDRPMRGSHGEGAAGGLRCAVRAARAARGHAAQTEH